MKNAPSCHVIRNHLKLKEIHETLPDGTSARRMIITNLLETGITSAKAAKTMTIDSHRFLKWLQTGKGLPKKTLSIIAAHFSLAEKDVLLGQSREEKATLTLRKRLEEINDQNSNIAVVISAMLKNNVSMTRLCREANVSPSSLKHWFDRGTCMSQESLNRIESYFNITKDSLHTAQKRKPAKQNHIQKNKTARALIKTKIDDFGTTPSLISKILKIKRGHLSRWLKTGNPILPTETLVRLAQHFGVPEKDVVIVIDSDKATAPAPHVRARWMTRLDLIKNKQSFQAIVVSAMIAQEISPGALCREMNINRSNFYQWLKGDGGLSTGLSTSRLQRISTFLDISSDSIAVAEIEKKDVLSLHKIKERLSTHAYPDSRVALVLSTLVARRLSLTELANSANTPSPAVFNWIRTGVGLSDSRLNKIEAFLCLPKDSLLRNKNIPEQRSFDKLKVRFNQLKDLSTPPAIVISAMLSRRVSPVLLCKKTGIKSPNLYIWMKSGSGISAQRLEKIAECLGIAKESIIN